MAVDLKNLESCAVSELVVLVKQSLQRVETLEAEDASLLERLRASKRATAQFSTAAPASNFTGFEIGHAEIGTREVTGSGHNPRIVACHRSTSLDAPSASKDETPCCSSFVNWCVERSGHAATDSAWASFWLSRGRPTDTPTKGCIVVFARETRSGHIAFLFSKTATKIKVFGGNQSDEVNISEYPANRLLGYRVPV